jgi:hypothetical protein
VWPATVSTGRILVNKMVGFYVAPTHFMSYCHLIPITGGGRPKVPRFMHYFRKKRAPEKNVP